MIGSRIFACTGELIAQKDGNILLSIFRIAAEKSAYQLAGQWLPIVECGSLYF